MLEQVGAAQGLDILFHKLGHHLPEIRARALSSILSKLEHGLLHESNLIQERQLFIKLMEWFNFHPAPMKEEVFKLMLMLSKHAHAREVLVSLGAIQFLTDLRPDIPSALKGDLDVLLENLMHTTESVNRGERCMYRSIDTTQESEEVHERPVSLPRMEVLSGYFEEPMESTDAHRKIVLGQEDTSSFITYPGFPWHFLTATDRHVLSSTSVSLCSSNSHLIQNACSFLLDVVLRDFPAEIFLQRPTIVNTLLTLLKSRPGADLMSIACECLSYIASNLLARILFYQDPDFHCPRQGLPLRQGSLFESGRGPQYSTLDDTEGHERNGGDGRDENSASSISSFTSTIPQFGDNDPRGATHEEDDSLEDDHMAALQLAQLSTHDFCVSCLQTAVPLLLIESPTLFLRAYEISIHCIQVLGHLLDADALWDAEQNSAKNFKSDIESLAKVISRAVLYHYHLECQEHPKQSQARNTSQEDARGWSMKKKSKHESAFHRVAYQACSALMIRFLKTAVPANRSSNIGSDLVSTALYLVSCDEPLQLTSSGGTDIAKEYLSHCDEEKYEVLSKLTLVLQSITDIHRFLDLCESEDNDDKLAFDLAESALKALPYYTVDEFIPVLVDVISKVCTDASNANCCSARRILLQLLAYPFVNVRSSAYQSCLKVVSSSVSVAAATDDPSGMSSYKCLFLMTSAVLYEITLHGLADSSPLINSPAQDLIMCLLRSKLLMRDDLWQNFVSVVKPVMPVLQTLVGEDELLRRAVFDFVVDNFDYPDVMVFLCRCLLLKRRNVRTVAGELLIKKLASYHKELLKDSKDSEDDTVTKLLGYASNIIDITDILIVDKPLGLTSSPVSANTIDAGLFHEDAVVRMLGIFRSRTISWPVRRSALQQLSVILNDKNMHNVFLKSDGLESVKSHMFMLATNSVLTEVENSEALACLAIIKAVAVWNRDLRKSLIVPATILALLKLSDLCRLFPVTANLVTQTIALFLLHDVLQQKEDSDDSTRQQDFAEPSLPSRVTSHFQIPFFCSAHDVISKNCTTSSPPSHCDLLLTGPPAFAIRIRITLTQNDGDVKRAIENSRAHVPDCGALDEDMPGRSNSFKVMAEHTAIIYSHPPTAVEEMVSAIQKANAHAAVSHALSLIRILLKSNPVQFSGVMFSCDIWRTAVEKFLQVLPSSTRDIELLWAVVGMLGDLLNTVSSTEFDALETSGAEDTLLWYLKMCVPKGPSTGLELKEMPLFALLQTSEVQSEQGNSGVSSVTLQRHLCKTILSMVGYISRRIYAITDKDIVYRFQAVLCQIILLRLKLADTPRFYDLPSMEVTLDCLVHNTATTGWTNVQEHLEQGIPDGSILCTQLLSSLLEVVSAFHIENRGSSMSYMGKGVSKSATRGIVHLVYELAMKMDASHNKVPGWLNVIARALTLYDTKQPDDGYSPRAREASFEWILALWLARDPRIRYSGLALGVALTTTSMGAELVKNNFQKYGGIWNAAFSALFDSTECSAVRAQAADLICNLICHNFQSEGNGDLSALIRLLNRVKLPQSLSNLLSRYHSSYLIQPVTIVYTPFLSSASTSSSETSLPSGNLRSERNRYQQTTGAQDERPIYQNRDGIEQLSENSYNSEFPSEWQAVCTPVLVASICRMLRNTIEISKDAMIMLRRESIVEQIAHMVDFPVLMSYLSECTSELKSRNVTRGRLGLTATALIEQYTETCKMLHTYATQEKGVAFSLLKDTELLASTVNLMTIVVPEQPWSQRISEMRKSAMDFVSCILFQCRPQASITVTRTVSNCWPSFSKSVQFVLSKRDEEISLLSLMTMLSNLLTSHIVLTKEKRVSLPAGFDHPATESDMSVFCVSLVEIFENIMVKKDVKSLEGMIKCADALQAVFTCFPFSRKKASESGFLENIVEEIKYLHSQLELLAINEKHSKTSNRGAQATTDHLLKKLLVHLRVLGSFVRESSEIQISAADLGVGCILEKLWSWVVIFPKLKSTILKLATCFTFNCDQACSSISAATPGHQPFVHHIISEAQELNSRILLARKVQVLHLQTVHQLLCNLSMSRECRSLLWKSGFMKEFTTVADRGQHPKATKQQRLLLLNWLKMFHCLSYFTDGQLNILKITDILEILSSVSNNTNHSGIVLKILCNLCYHGPSKPRISSNKAALDMLTKGMSSSSQFSAVSGIWALLSSSQKSKVHLKVAGITSKIHSALASVNQNVTEEQDSDVQYRLTAILDVMQS